MLRKIFATGLAMSLVQMVPAQDSSTHGSLTISGVADVYYKYDFGRSPGNNITSFTGIHNSFAPGMASLKFNYKTEKVELVADLGFGKRAAEFSYNDEGVLAAVKQVYASYVAASWLKLTAGSWATHVGYELVDPHLNRNYSMSYMFTNGPFFHTGVKADVSFHTSGFMIGIANPNDMKYVPEGVINKKFLLAQYSFTPGEFFNAYLNYAGGKSIDSTRADQLDLVLVSRLNEKFSVAYNGTLNRTRTYLGNKVYDKTKSWWGSAVYLSFDATENFSLALREEFFSDKNRLKVFASHLSGGDIFASTLSANIKSSNFILIPEIRLDKASEPIFTGRDGLPKRTSANLLLAAIFHF